MNFCHSDNRVLVAIDILYKICAIIISIHLNDGKALFSGYYFFFFFFIFSLPWNQDTVFGYFAEMLFMTDLFTIYLVVFGSISLLLVSLCIHYQAFCDMLKHMIDKCERSHNYPGNDEQFICDIIRFHLTAKE